MHTVEAVDRKRASILGRLNSYVLEPFSDVEGADKRRQARLLTAFLTILIPAGAVMATVLYQTDPEDPRIIGALIVMVSSIILHYPSRRKYTDIIGFLAVISVTIPPFFNYEAGKEATDAFSFLAVPIIVGSLWLKPKRYAIVGLLIFLAVITIPFLMGKPLAGVLIRQIPIWVLLISGLTLVSLTLRRGYQVRLESRTQELEDEVVMRKEVEAELAEHRDNLEVLVEQRTGELATANQNLEGALNNVKELSAKLEAENILLREEIGALNTSDEIIGASKEIKEVLHSINKVANSDTSVLITGETGTGKELLARQVHQQSPRGGQSMVVINCGAIPKDLVESELFGHEKGAFTGAYNQKIGKFERANGGTIFLDEIGEMPLAIQPKLLRVLQERRFSRVGSSEEIEVDVRLIAATNRHLKDEIRAGNFREDLFFRVNGFPILVPPLRERKEDISLLVKHFVKRFNKKLNRSIEDISPVAMDALCEYPWPGNIRELENMIERAVLFCDESTLKLTPAMMSELLQKPSNGIDTVNSILRELADVEREHIRRVLEHTKWKISGPNGAAKILGLNSNTLRSRIDRLGGLEKP